MSDEQKVPTKEEIIAFIKEQIEVKKFQLELQEINTGLAVARMEEIKALAMIGQMTNPQKPQGTKHVVTQEDLDNNPEFAAQGINVGETVIIPDEPEETTSTQK